MKVRIVKLGDDLLSKYLFRADGSYKSGEDVMAKDVNSDVSALQHIAQGSKNVKSKYISTTKKVATAVTYSLGVVKKNKNKIIDGVEDHVRTPVLLIDCEKLEKHGAVLHDAEVLKSDSLKSATPENRAFWEEQKENYGQYLRMAQKFAPSSREVLVEDKIPSDCVKEIPMICVDMLEALEDFEVEYPRLYTPFKNLVLDKIMTDDEEFKQKISEIHFDGKLQEFYEEYYKEGNKSLKDVSKGVFGKDDEEGLLLANCSRVQIIKDVFRKVRTTIGNYLHFLLLENVEESLREREEFSGEAEKGEMRNGILKNYTSVISSNVTRRDGKPKSDWLERSSDYYSTYMLGDSRCIKLNLDGHFNLAGGIEFEGDEAIPVVKRITREEKGEKPKAGMLTYGHKVKIESLKKEEKKFIKVLQDEVKSPEEISTSEEKQTTKDDKEQVDKDDKDKGEER